MNATERRLQLVRAGFVPLPLFGKAPPVYGKNNAEKGLAGWEKLNGVTPGQIDMWAKTWPDAINTGVLTKYVPALDLDILNDEAVRTIEDHVREHYEEHGYILPRIGKPPKRAILFRTDEPFAKILVNLVAPNGGTEKIEFLADGQQVVCFGTHPETHELYRWFGGEPGKISREELPYIRQAEAQALVDDIVRILVDQFGYARANERPRQALNGAGGDAEEIDRATAAQDWKYLLDNIREGRALHDSLRDLAAKLIVSGMSAGAAVNHLRSLLEGSAAPRDDRWQERYGDIPHLVESAEAKFRGDSSNKTNGGASPPGLNVWNAGHDADLPPPRGWLLGNTFCREFLSSLLGNGGAGKTAVRILQAISAATGRVLTGEHVFERARVLLVSLEDGVDELRRRVLAARLHYDIPLAELDGWLFLSAPGNAAGKLMTIDRRGHVAIGELSTNLEAEIIAHKISLVLVDPFVKTHSIPENDNNGMDSVAQLLTDLAVKHHVAIDAPHHISKGAADPGNADRGRGASSTVNAGRLVYTLSGMRTEEAQHFNIPEDERRDYVRLDRAKLNIARTSGACQWFKLVSVRLDNANPLYPNGDEVQTVEVWKPSSVWAGLDTNRILTAIDAGLEGGNYFTDAAKAPGREAWQVVQRFAPDKNEAQAREVIRTWVKNGVLVPFDYSNPVTRKSVRGLRVNSAKRPG